MRCLCNSCCRYAPVRRWTRCWPRVLSVNLSATVASSAFLLRPVPAVGPLVVPYPTGNTQTSAHQLSDGRCSTSQTASILRRPRLDLARNRARRQELSRGAARSYPTPVGSASIGKLSVPRENATDGAAP
jgi:hypothetical protein